MARPVFLFLSKKFADGVDLQRKKNGTGTLLHVTQDGYREGEAWDWYYEAVLKAWPSALEGLKKYLSVKNRFIATGH
jgi:hypothetical protein